MTVILNQVYQQTANRLATSAQEPQQNKQRTDCLRGRPTVADVTSQQVAIEVSPSPIIDNRLFNRRRPNEGPHTSRFPSFCNPGFRMNVPDMPSPRGGNAPIDMISTPQSQEFQNSITPVLAPLDRRSVIVVNMLSSRPSHTPGTLQPVHHKNGTRRPDGSQPVTLMEEIPLA